MNELLYDCSQDIKKTINKRIDWLEKHKTKEFVELTLGKLLYWKNQKELFEYLGWDIKIPFEFGIIRLCQESNLATFYNKTIKVNPHLLITRFQEILNILEKSIQHNSFKIKIDFSEKGDLLIDEMKSFELYEKSKNLHKNILKDDEKTIDIRNIYMNEVNRRITEWIKNRKLTRLKSRIVDLIIHECYEKILTEKKYKNETFQDFCEVVYPKLKYRKDWNLKSFTSLMYKRRSIILA